MKFLLLSYTPAADWHPETTERASDAALAAFDAYQRFEAELRETGEFVFGEGLGHPTVSTTVRRTQTGVVATEGPFAEPERVLASFAVVECSSLARARDIAARIVDIFGDPIEIRPIVGEDFVDD